MADLTPKQERAIIALMSSSTLTEAARAANVGERTLYTWLADTAFSEAYRAARRESVGQSIARLQQASGAAVDTLVSLLGSNLHSVRLAAASKILELSVKAIEIEDLQQRLEALEVAYGQKL